MSLNTAQTSISYKDPHGYVLRSGEKYYRVVDQSYEAQYTHLLRSGLYEKLLAEKLVIPFQELDDKGVTGGKDVFKLLLPEQIPLVTYPYEWSFEQWKDGIRCFLRVMQIALEHRMILKDATPFNFTLHKGKFVLLDILSFEWYKEGDPWIAYRQFCETFLSPLSLMRYRGVLWSRLFRSSMQGMDLAFVSRSLPRKSYASITCLLHIHLHAKFKPAKENSNQKQRTYYRKGQLAQLLQSMEASVKKWNTGTAINSSWNQYYQKDIESAAYLEDKKAIVHRWLEQVQPQTLIDLGANTGMFSEIASRYAEQVIAIEPDPVSHGMIYTNLRSANNTRIYPVCANLTDPSPAQGWENTEIPSLLSRMKADTLLALAVIHHLRITCHVPVHLIAKHFSSLCSRYLLLEFVPKSDRQIITMLGHREDIYTDYTIDNLITVFGWYFTLVEKTTIAGSGRVLLLWEKIATRM